MTSKLRLLPRISLLAFAAAFAAPAAAQSGQSAGQAASVDQEITVTGWRLRQLDTVTPTGSRLDLSIRDTPATLDRITADEMLTRGFRTVEEATDSLPGIISGGSPGNPTLFSMRGFTGEQITILHNGLYLGPANMINRPGNTFNLASIDVLKGPASVLYGQGAVGGAVNIVSKHPDFKGNSGQALASYGEFDTVSLGAGGNRVLSDTLAGRVDVSYHRSNGYVDDTGPHSFNATGALLYRPSSDLSVELSVDYLRDRLPTYYGTPLLPAAAATDPIPGILTSANGAVVDRRTRFVNYNVGDSRANSWQVWPRLAVTWSPSDAVTLSNTAYYFHADRAWINAESYAYNAATGRVDRDRFFVFHNQDLVGDQGSATFRHSLAGMANQLVIGFDYNHLDFVRSRGFPDGDSVDLLRPARGSFGALDRRVSPTRWDQIALFAEDALDLTAKLKLVTGLRAERLYLTRENYNLDGSFNAGSSFRRVYKPFNWRAGLVYDVTPAITTYASFSTGQDPVGSNIFLVNAGQNFALSNSRQVEAGVKAALLNGRASLTAAVYDIERRNILTQVAIDTVSNIGSQRSRGIELSGEARLTPHWAVTASGTYVDAAYGSFTDPNYGVAASGNRPPNVPDWTANVWTSVQQIAGLPLEAGGGVKYVGQRYGNTANTLVLRPYATGIVYATWAVNPRLSLTGRVNNVWNKTFVQWADIYYPAQVMLGEPRRAEVSLLARF
ncbi:TonB-dependent receptor [Sphingomonas hengshuiensis]|uniref:TonB-dependent receptor n=1 Tax=Sphingomonas hengshuiensis TaxID=1609977 RepID=A0A7U5HVL5_9SPHN|nr:TonB-dependent receptor [Sphingomonas hengshuiensis]AJP70684.1 TonB-dependent receptor [Sphingomonas hengshuiensis]